MSETAQATFSPNLTEEQYRKQCKEIRQYQLAKTKGRKKAKPILKPIGNTVSIDKKIIVSQNPSDWDELKSGAPFALDPQATLIYTKAGTARALCLNTMSTVTVGGAAVYRCFL